MTFKPLCKCAIAGLSIAIGLAFVACSDSGTKVAASGQPGVEEAAGQQVSVNYNHSQSFAQYHTYAWGSS